LKSQGNYNNPKGGLSCKKAKVVSILAIIIKKLFIALELPTVGTDLTEGMRIKIRHARGIRSFFQT
jgi:hypothetical protein